ncbi:SDR family NAD(P)-dependent oxidoreductase [Corallococcus sp. AB011P]|uniref:SDR family NAD(P)-dependent oxidoreductase n=1 Tax=Corallococcus sp. AB011P TaxID=2316735 RepID=UPI000EA21DF1|nr:SDR family NAD(P)-dependent oxidoreductase [Corallococcus sp. AB011P]RKG58350.1 SDR family NAD(P)-dependent oxidoreductase [Corallococcus sp. AB011P]
MNQSRFADKHALNVDGIAARLSAALLTDPQVRECAVLPRQESGGHSLVAYVVATGPVTLEGARALADRQGVSARELVAVVPLTRLPRDGGGQLDLARLQRTPLLDEKAFATLRERLLALDPTAELVSEAVPLKAPMPLAEGPTQVSTRQALLQGPELPDSPDTPTTLAEVLERAARISPEYGVRFLTSAGERFSSYPELLAEARRIAGGLVSANLPPGSELIMQLASPDDFVPAFWGAVLAGLVPVPLAVPVLLSAGEPASEKVRLTMARLPSAALITREDRAGQVAELLRAGGLTGRSVLSLDSLRRAAPLTHPVVRPPDAPALLLLTSGSTAEPKIVPQTHRRLISRSRATILTNGFRREEVSLNWLPLDHVGGLVMFHLRDVVCGCSQLQAETNLVLKYPLIWMDWCSQYQVTVTWAPNFGYSLLNTRAKEVRTKRWDLSALWFILNGGEAIVAEQAREFMELLAPHGLRADAMRPAWGMSETCSGVTFEHDFRGISTRTASVSVGRPIHGITVRIADDDGHVMGEGARGRLQIRGVSIFEGYLNNPEANRESFPGDGWFDTGDLGVIIDQGLHIVGRRKDVLIVNGLNIAPTEIERMVETNPDVVPAHTAAIAVREAGDITDQLALFLHTEKTGEAREALLSDLRIQLARTFGISPSVIVEVAPEEMPRTSIGKIQKDVLKSRLEKGLLVPAWQRGRKNTAAANNLFALPREEVLNGSVYRRNWVPHGLTPVRALPDTVVVFAPAGEPGKRLTAALATGQRRVLVVEPGTGFALNGGDRLTVLPGDAEDAARLVEHLADTAAGAPLIYAWPLAGKSGTEASFDATEALLALLPPLARRFGKNHPRLLAVTHGAARVGTGELLGDPKAAMFGALLRVVREETRADVRAVDIDSLEAFAEVVLGELTDPSGEVECAYRRGLRRVSRLAPVRLQEQGGTLRQGKRYVVIGGLGGIGRALVRYLVTAFGARVAILGRRAERALDPASAAALTGLRQLGAVTYGAGDVSDSDGLRGALARASESLGGTPDGVFHLAGGFFEQTLEQLEWDKALGGMIAKVSGSREVVEAAEALGIPWVALFSSVNGYFGGPGLATYAAANRFQEALAGSWNGKGTRVCTLAWSMWDETGLSRGYANKELTRERGFVVFSPDAALQLLDSALSQAQDTLFIGLDATRPRMRVELDMSPEPLTCLTARTSAEPRAIHALGDAFGIELTVRPRSSTAAPAKAAGVEALAARTATAPAAIAEQLAALWCDVLKVDTEELAHDANVFDLGAHSLLLPNMQERIREAFGVEPTVVDLFQYPTVAKLTAYLASRLSAMAEQQAQASVAPATDPTAMAEQLATLWCDVLKVDTEELTHDANVFDLGAHSLLLPNMQGRIREAFGVEPTVVDLFQYPTVAKLTAYLASRLTSTES